MTCSNGSKIFIAEYLKWAARDNCLFGHIADFLSLKLVISFSDCVLAALDFSFSAGLLCFQFLTFGSLVFHCIWGGQLLYPLYWIPFWTMKYYTTVDDKVPTITIQNRFWYLSRWGQTVSPHGAQGLFCIFYTKLLLNVVKRVVPHAVPVSVSEHESGSLKIKGTA